jgi:hypothetical protein
VEHPDAGFDWVQADKRVKKAPGVALSVSPE